MDFNIRLSPSVIGNNQVSSIFQIKFCAVTHSISYVFRVTEHIFWQISTVWLGGQLGRKIFLTSYCQNQWSVHGMMIFWWNRHSSHQSCLFDDNFFAISRCRWHSIIELFTISVSIKESSCKKVICKWQKLSNSLSVCADLSLLHSVCR